MRIITAKVEFRSEIKTIGPEIIQDAVGHMICALESVGSWCKTWGKEADSEHQTDMDEAQQTFTLAPLFESGQVFSPVDGLIQKRPLGVLLGGKEPYIPTWQNQTAGNVRYHKHMFPFHCYQMLWNQNPFQSWIPSFLLTLRFKLSFGLGLTISRPTGCILLADTAWHW
jgi:hypothetical protein